MFQFLKHTGSQFGESRAAKKLGIPMEAMGDGFTWRSKDMDQTQELARQQWENCKTAILSDEYDVIVMDEFTYPLHYGWIPVADVIEVLRQKPEMLHIVITGRYAPDELVEFADLVTEMKEIKHPYREQGIKAQPGLEF
jgi:cob(I)alamin adenosyltransferase